MTGLDPAQFRAHVIDPTLRLLSLYSPAASNLLLGTALTESGLVYLHQLGAGPALGLFQCEPATLDDILENYLPGHPDLYGKILALVGASLSHEQSLVTNLAYAAAICRVHYLRVPAALPAADDAMALALYHKRFYNSMLGATDPAKSVVHFQQAIAA